MPHFSSHTLAAIAAVLLIAGPQPAIAGSFEVAPTMLTIEKTTEPALFYITNHGDEPIVAQVETYAWHQDGQADQLDPSTSLIISPPMMRLAPNQKQTVRLMARGDARGMGERAFRLIVSEIPDGSLNDAQHGVRMLLQFSVPVFIGGGAQKSDLSWSAQRDADGVVLTAHNAGLGHAKISAVALANAMGEKIPANDDKFRYILAGSSASWRFSEPPAPAPSLHINAFDDITRTTIDLSLPTP